MKRHCIISRNAVKAAILLCVFCATCGEPRTTHGVLGDVLATFPFRVGQFLADPTQPIMYATDLDNNSLELIDTCVRRKSQTRSRCRV